MHRSTTLPALIFSLVIGSAQAAPKRVAPPQQAPRPAPTLVPEPAERPSTLISSDDRLGWYVAPSLGYTSIRSNAGLLVGGKGGVILNHRLVLGAAGYVYVNDAFGNTGAVADFGYGGAYLEYIFRPQELFHFSLSTVLGGGTANTDFVLVANPAVNGILNLSSTVHLGVEIAYRATKVMATNRPNTGWFSGPSFALFLQFGQF